MTPIFWTWLLSLAGAGLFFMAGAALAARKYARAELPAPAQDETLARVRQRCSTLEREIAAQATERERIERALESERAAAAAQLEGLQDTIAQLSRVDGGEPLRAGLSQELALSQDMLRGRETQLEHLREENARLRGVELELAQTKRELADLVEKNRELRAQAFASKPAPTPTPRKASRSQPVLSTHGRALQTICDTEIQLGGVKSAVIADELGLLVAASGASNEYNDALAALGAYLADVGTKTRDVLPLHEVRQVVVRDEHDVTFTVRPLATDDPGLALVTLAVDADAQRLTETRHN